MATKLPDDFKEFLKLLNVREVEYLLIGGYAVGYHGYARATDDMDIWVRIHPDNAQKVVDALKEFGFDVPELSLELFLKPDQIIRMGRPPLRLEVTTTIDGVEFGDCYSRRIVDEMDGLEVSLIGYDDLLVNKAASGRDKDMLDLKKLKESKKPKKKPRRDK